MHLIFLLKYFILASVSIMFNWQARQCVQKYLLQYNHLMQGCQLFCSLKHNYVIKLN